MPKSSVLSFDVRDDLRESERSGIRASVQPIEHRTTAKVPRVDLERLLAAERERADLDADAHADETVMAFPAFPDVEPPTVERTVSMIAPRMSALSGIPSPIDGAPISQPMSQRPTPIPRMRSDLPEEMPELTAVLKFTPVPIPVASLAAPSFEAMRAARNEARRTRYLVVGIWAFALSLASSLGYVIATHG